MSVDFLFNLLTTLFGAMPPSKSLIFVDCGDAGVKALSVSAGQVLKISDVSAPPEMSKAELKEAVGAMTVKGIEDMARNLGFRITNSKKGGKDSLVEFVVNEWQNFQTRATRRATNAGASSSAQPRDAPEFKHGGLPSGYGLLIDKIDPAMKGFQVFFMGGKLHITTDFGCHQICDDVEEEREWMSQHNFVMTGRKDWMEDNGRDELSPHSSDPSKSDTDTEDEQNKQDETDKDDEQDTKEIETEKKAMYKAFAEFKKVKGNNEIFLNEEDENSKGILTVEFETFADKGCFKFHYNEQDTFKTFSQLLKGKFGIDVGEALGMATFKLKIGASYVEMWEPIASCVSATSNTAYLIPSFSGGAKPVIKVEKLAISKTKCATLAQKVPPSSQTGLVKYDQTYRTLTETPDAISKMIAQMSLDDVNAVLQMYEEGGIKEQTMGKLAKLVVADIKEVETKKDEYANLYTALVQAFHFAMLNGYYNETKGKVIFKDVEETKAKFASGQPVPMAT